MCGRFNLNSKINELIKRYKLAGIEFEIKPRFNIAPTQAINVIIQSDTPALKQMRWGLIPSWAKEGKAKFTMFNTRTESILEKPYFKGLLRHKRCLIPATGFYEWKHVGKEKMPYNILTTDQKIFSFAGLYDGETTSIITTEANSFMKKIHDRMPVILKPKDESIWLNETDDEKLTNLLYQYPAGKLTMYQVSQRVNSNKEDVEGMIKAV